MKEIGGYFGLETKTYNNFSLTGGLYLNSGRSALACLLKSFRKISTLYIPYFTCSAILEPIKVLNINYRFYSINERLEIKDHIKLKSNDLILYTNYFGIQSEYVIGLVERYGTRLILDNAQALYDNPISGISTFYSPRKFVGIPDGGIAFPINPINDSSMDQDYSHDRCSHLLIRLDRSATSGYTDFKENSKELVYQSTLKMSQLTRTLISGIDFQAIYEKRKENFIYLHSVLKDHNKLRVEPEKIICPMVYPYRTMNKSLRQRLIDNKIFIPTYWPNVFEWRKEEDTEFQLADTILPLPIDQRYDRYDMEKIYSIIIDSI